MAVSGRVQVIHEVSLSQPDDWTLCLQWCRYFYDDGSDETGYRFIWRRPKSRHLQGARGQARLPSMRVMRKLMQMADDANWGHLVGTGDELF
ncbi:hypothetical protein IHQ68_19710 [Chelatococcus sambhunathii]|uniref:Uncharacterized protein n=1 Tax=Chelatococcus sambhunathii TaxID=363953 RepID=A0ABU1DLI6_9HYPH|nr:hypothetical protein [Chelatococcus sambhunathii]MDR4308854.1 hypothetical protein [Chelatococcus sambhunathii]